MVTRKKQFEETSKKMAKALKALKELQDAEIRDYGFTHNERDLDSIIDAIDYGGNFLKFEEYQRLMQEEKEKNGESE